MHASKFRITTWMREGLIQADWTEYCDNEIEFILVMNSPVNQKLIITLLHSLETQPFIFLHLLDRLYGWMYNHMVINDKDFHVIEWTDYCISMLMGILFMQINILLH